MRSRAQLGTVPDCGRDRQPLGAMGQPRHDDRPSIAVSWADAERTTMRFRCRGCLGHIDIPRGAVAQEKADELRDWLHVHRRCETNAEGGSAVRSQALPLAGPERTAPVHGLLRGGR